jgi:hypothetical protein
MTWVFQGRYYRKALRPYRTLHMVRGKEDTIQEV